MESGRARKSAKDGDRGDAGATGDARVTMSPISRAIHSTSSETSSSTNEEIELLRTGSVRSGIEFTKRTDACWDLKVGARMRLE